MPVYSLTFQIKSDKTLVRILSLPLKFPFIIPVLFPYTHIFTLHSTQNADY